MPKFTAESLSHTFISVVLFLSFLNFLATLWAISSFPWAAYYSAFFGFILLLMGSVDFLLGKKFKVDAFAYLGAKMILALGTIVPFAAAGIIHWRIGHTPH